MLDPGGSTGVDKQVRTPAIPPRPDVVLLVDGTASMADPIGSVRENLPAITGKILAEQPDSRFAVATFGDQEGDVDAGFKVLTGLTDDLTKVQEGVDGLRTDLGGASRGPSGTGIVRGAATGAVGGHAGGGGGRGTDVDRAAAAGGPVVRRCVERPRGELKPSLDLVISVPVTASPVYEAGLPVGDEGLRAEFGEHARVGSRGERGCGGGGGRGCDGAAAWTAGAAGVNSVASRPAGPRAVCRRAGRRAGAGGVVADHGAAGDGARGRERGAGRRGTSAAGTRGKASKAGGAGGAGKAGRAHETDEADEGRDG
ncbi:hypothetical protein SCALM49S_01355 [Streptomyces californicus]